MEIIGQERIYLLIQMAYHFAKIAGREKVEQLPVHDIERNCWRLIYHLLEDSAEVEAMIDEAQPDYVCHSDLANAELTYPYLTNDIDCMEELWRLYCYFQRDKTDYNSSIREANRARDQFIVGLLLKREWSESDFRVTRELINQSILGRLFVPLISPVSQSKFQDPDLPPF